MRRGIDEGAVVVLAVNFDQRGAERAQHLHADRLIVDEGAGAAVGKLHPAHDQFVIAAEIVVGEYAARRMCLGDVEDGGHLPLLGALAHQRRIAARAERKREGIEQDRFAGAGLAGQHGKAGAEIDVQPIDQDDVADGKAGQHDQQADWNDTELSIGRDFRNHAFEPRLLPIPGRRVRYPLIHRRRCDRRRCDRWLRGCAAGRGSSSALKRPG